MVGFQLVVGNLKLEVPFSRSPPLGVQSLGPVVFKPLSPGAVRADEGPAVCFQALHGCFDQAASAPACLSGIRVTTVISFGGGGTYFLMKVCKPWLYIILSYKISRKAYPYFMDEALSVRIELLQDRHSVKT